jgi:hypothetical protein
MTIGFAGESNLISNVLEEFGNPNHTNRISKHILYDLCKKTGITSASFDEWFPRGTVATGDSVIQALVLDLRTFASFKTERLTLCCQFGSEQADVSPKNIQVVLLTVHPNGQAICKYEQTAGGYNYNWSFTQGV